MRRGAGRRVCGRARRNGRGGPWWVGWGLWRASGGCVVLQTDVPIRSLLGMLQRCSSRAGSDSIRLLYREVWPQWCRHALRSPIPRFSGVGRGKSFTSEWAAAGYRNIVHELYNTRDHSGLFQCRVLESNNAHEMYMKGQSRWLELHVPLPHTFETPKPYGRLEDDSCMFSHGTRLHHSTSSRIR